MTDNLCELVQSCLDTEEFSTIELHGRYFLLHQNIIRHSTSPSIGFELPCAILRKIFPAHCRSSIGAKASSHVDPSLYEIIIFADRSAVYTRSRTKSSHTQPDLPTNEPTKQPLPYYVQEDLDLLRKIGLSREELNSFVEKLNENERSHRCAAVDDLNSSQYETIIQKIIDLTDVPTRLNCRQVSRRWKRLVDQSSSWKHLKLFKLHHYVDRALLYFQNIDIRDLDLADSLFELSTFEFKPELCVYSLRSLRISTDHPFELFTLLFKIAPFLQYIQLIQTYDSSLKWKSNTQLYECINFVIYQCQERLKCLRRLHVQLRSVSDQIFLQSSSVTSIPISYEVITC